jgi:hypothetical protein
MATRTTKWELEAEVEMRQMRIRELEMLLEAKNNPGVHFKVSTRGAVSIYGLQRFPITLYRNQWERLLAHQDELKQFMKDDASKLAVKKS